MKSNKNVFYLFPITNTCICDGCLLRQSQRMHVSFYFFFLCKRATLWYNDVNRNISPTILRQKSYQFFFSLFLSLLLVRLFLLVWSKEDKELDSNKLKSFAKNTLLFCKPPLPSATRLVHVTFNVDWKQFKCYQILQYLWAIWIYIKFTIK